MIRYNTSRHDQVSGECRNEHRVGRERDIESVLAGFEDDSSPTREISIVTSDLLSGIWTEIRRMALVKMREHSRGYMERCGAVKEYCLVMAL